MRRQKVHVVTLMFPAEKPSTVAALVPPSELVAVGLGGLVAGATLLQTNGRNIGEALLVTAAFAITGWFVRGVNQAGATAGGAIAFALFVAGGWRLFAVLFLLFAITAVATRFGQRRKARLGLAEAPAGRDAGQVMANLGVAGSMAALAVLFPNRCWIAMLVAVLAEVAADTVSSEVGEAIGGEPVLVVSFERVAPGTDGAISLTGTLAGTAAAAAITTAAYLAGAVLITPGELALVLVAAIAGTLLDSLLGATLERAGGIGNNAVNLLSTAATAALAWLLLR